MLDDQTFGFNKPDALELVQLIGGADREHDEWHDVPDGGGGGGGKLQGTLTALVGSVATITVVVAPCDRPELRGTSVEVTDHSGCVFDLTEEQLLGVWVWASEGVISAEGDCLWCADDRCCVAADSEVVIDGGSP